MNRLPLVINLAVTLFAAVVTGGLLVGAFDVSTPVRVGFTVLAFLLFWSQVSQFRNVRTIAVLTRALSKIGPDEYEDEPQVGLVHGGGEWRDLGASLEDLHAAISHVESRVASSAAKADQGSAQRRLILKSMADGLLAIDIEEHVVLLNTAAVRLLDLPKANHQGHLLEDVTSRTEVLLMMKKCLKDGYSARERVELAYANGVHSRVLELRVAPLESEHSQQRAGCVLVIEDRTELDRLERVRRDFVSNVSHELKTPLTSVRGYLDTLIDDPEVDPEIRQRFLIKANNNAERLAAIVGDLISLARAESEEGDAIRAPVNLAEVVRDVVLEAAPTAELKGIHIAIHAESSCTILGDRLALQTALLNLVHNAIHYSPSNIEVRVRLTRKVGSVVLAVEDDGPGIPASHQERLFERFYRVDKDRSRELGGTGLGLSIVRNVAAAHGGTAGVESETGEGSRFWIELPLSDLV